MKATTKKPAKTPSVHVFHIPGNARVIVCSTDLQGLFLDINEGGVGMLTGKTREDLIGKVSLGSFFRNPADWELLQNRLIRSGFVQEFETRFCCPSKRMMDVQITAATRQNGDGAITGYDAFILNITASKKTEEALKNSEEMYRMIVENSQISISVHHKGVLQYVNQRYCDAGGYKDPEEVLGKPFWHGVHPDDRAAVKEFGLKKERGEPAPFRYTFRAIKKDKSLAWVETRINPSMHKGKKVAIVNSFGVTKRKIAEEEIRNLSQRLVQVREEERRKLAADIHDELGQTLTAIHFGLNALHKIIEPEQLEQRNSCNHLIRSVERLADAVRENTSFLLPPILDQMFLVPALKQQIGEFAKNHPAIQIDFRPLGFKKQLAPEIEMAIYRIVQESLTNIVKHAEATKVRIIMTYNHPYVFLTIRDNGAGCPEPEKKIQGEHATRGIGLRGMRERVVSLGGTFKILSSPGKGTTIAVDLPV